MTNYSKGNQRPTSRGGERKPSYNKKRETTKRPSAMKPYFIGEEKVSIGELPHFDVDIVERSGLKLHVLQAIYLMKDRMTADNDWISIYAVLLDRHDIVKTMTSFCSMINNVFGIPLNSRYMSATLRDHGEDIEKWSDVYDDQRRHLSLVKEFRKLLGKLERK